MIERVNFTEEKKMSEWIRKINWKYVVVMLIGNIILGLGIAIFKLSGLGNDPFSGMVMALAECGIFCNRNYLGKKAYRIGNDHKCVISWIFCYIFLKLDHICDRCTGSDGNAGGYRIYWSYHNKPWNFHVPASETGSCTI